MDKFGISNFCFIKIFGRVYKVTCSLLRTKKILRSNFCKGTNKQKFLFRLISGRRTSDISTSINFTWNSLKNRCKVAENLQKLITNLPKNLYRDTHSQTSKTTCCRRSGNFCTIVTGCPLVRLMPYIGAVVLYLVLQSRAGEPQLSFVENARPENPVTIISWEHNFFSHYNMHNVA